MKKTLLLMSLAAVAVLPAVAHADSPSTRNAKITQTTPAKPVKATKTVYYISQEPRTGSLIPAVYRRYDGRIDSASSPAIYGQATIQASGALDVGAALNRLDPAITVRSHG